MKTNTTTMILKKSTCDAFNVISSDNFTVSYTIGHHDDGSVSINYNLYPTITINHNQYAPMLDILKGQFFADNAEDGENEMMRMFMLNNNLAERDHRLRWFGRTDYDSVFLYVPACKFEYDMGIFKYMDTDHKHHQIAFNRKVVNITNDFARLSYYADNVCDGEFHADYEEIEAIKIDSTYDIIINDN